MYVPYGVQHGVKNANAPKCFESLCGALYGCQSCTHGARAVGHKAAAATWQHCVSFGPCSCRYAGASHRRRAAPCLLLTRTLRRLRLRLLRQQVSHGNLALLALAGCCLCLVLWRSWRGSAVAAVGGHRLLGTQVHFPSLPVFVINGPEDYAARKWVEQQLASVGVTSYERINGVVVEADDCMRLSGEGCQQGLALAHLSAWRRIAARQLPMALVVEDDVTWHRDFATLLPRYLAQAPSVRAP